MRISQDRARGSAFMNSIEALESRIAPAAVLAIDDANKLLVFDSTKPQVILESTAITGLSADDQVVGIDFRPADGTRVALTKNASDTGRLYTINYATGVATFKVQLDTPLEGTRFGIDFNPIVDALRVTSDTDRNMRVNVESGLVTIDTPLDYMADDVNAAFNPTVIEVAYSNSFVGAAGTTLYGIDTVRDVLVIHNPPNSGLLTTVSSLRVNADHVSGFDLLPAAAKGFAAIESAGTTRLYSVDLKTGKATAINKMGDGTHILGMALLPSGLNFANPKAVSFTDLEGDLVTVRTSAGKFTLADFMMRTPISSGGTQLMELNLSDDGDEFSGASITVTAKKGKLGGDGLAAIGSLNATGIDLAKVTIAGDLGRINVGDSDSATPALKSLSVTTTGLYGVATQPAGGNLASTINGSLGSLKTARDFHGYVNSAGIGSISIGGSMIGGDDINEGSISSSAGIDSVSVKGDIRGGSGVSSGRIVAQGSIGPVKIGGDIRGGLQTDSGAILSGGNIQSVTIGGSLVAGSADFTGAVQALGTLGSVKIGKDILGTSDHAALLRGGGDTTPNTTSSVALKSLSVGGSVVYAEILGGFGYDSNPINGHVQIGAVTVGRNWIASSITAGYRDSGNDGFGINDTQIASGPAAVTSRIASIVIKGNILGTKTAGDHFGFVADTIPMFKVGGSRTNLSTTEENVIQFAAVTNFDVTLREG